MDTAVEQECMSVWVGVLQYWYTEILQGDERNSDAYEGEQCALAELLDSSPGVCVYPSHGYRTRDSSLVLGFQHALG
jgi:hypothetical protein